jgi:2-oxoglutarate ferredoxin oxidoreductase subunit alpha
MEQYKIMTGNEACALGAIAGGMNFFAGYPITPATEIAEISSELLPKYGGKFMQMEDEIASMAAIIGASLAGGKSMTATSGAGFSLMQENLGTAIMSEIPCVVVDVMRQGPSQGVATVPSQGDIMQAKWGTHGDHSIIALAPGSVSEAYFETIRAFNLAERFRSPVIILSDAILAHMSEKVLVPDPSKIKIVNRKRPTGPMDSSFRPYAADSDGVAPMATYGDGYRWYATGIVHDETGFPATNDPQKINDLVKRLIGKIENYQDEIESYEEYLTEDADILIVSIGLVGRSAKAAIDAARSMGINVGLFRPITVLPFPEKRLLELAKTSRVLMPCEMNEGQLATFVSQCVGTRNTLRKVTQNDGRIINSDTILAAIKEVV